jgi:hypothetical protein
VYNFKEKKMGFLKNRAIKSVTKKRFNQLLGLIENDQRHDPIDPMQTLKDYIGVIESSGGHIEVPSDITHWWELLVFLVCLMVRSELAYDPSMGTEEDIKLIMEQAYKELGKYKNESIFTKFARRSMIEKMAKK